MTTVTHPQNQSYVDAYWGHSVGNSSSHDTWFYPSILLDIILTDLCGAGGYRGGGCGDCGFSAGGGGGSDGGGGGGGGGHCWPSNCLTLYDGESSPDATHAHPPLESDEAALPPLGSPGVLHQPVVQAVLRAVTHYLEAPQSITPIPLSPSFSVVLASVMRHDGAVKSLSLYCLPSYVY